MGVPKLMSEATVPENKKSKIIDAANAGAAVAVNSAVKAASKRCLITSPQRPSTAVLASAAHTQRFPAPKGLRRTRGALAEEGRGKPRDFPMRP